jgi:hypothetical protein
MSEKIYAWLLKLYPMRFREEYGASALQLFRDRLGTERGVFRRFRFWFDVIADLAISVPREHWRQKPSEPAMGGSFRISEEAVGAMTKRGALAPAVFVSLFVVLGLTMGWLGNSKHVLLFAAYIPLAIVAIGHFRYIGRFERRWRSYQLVLETDRLQQRHDGKDVTVRKSEVFKINEDQHGLLVLSVRGYSQAAMGGPIDYRQVRERVLSIWIPAGLTGYQQVREQVLQWTDRVSQRRSLWLNDPRSVFLCTVCLLPAMLVVHSVPWLLTVAVIYYGMVLLLIMMHVVRPPRDSGLTPRQRGLDLPPPAYMWRRFKHSCRNPVLWVLVLLPILRIVVPS